AAYQRQIAWAKEYYQTYRDEIAKSAEARAAYNEYLASLEAQYLRQTESGLQAWVRDNKDATDAFKSLWKQSMDSFVDTVTDGLIEGRMQFKDFTEAILREIMRIMIAKSIAGIAETALGAFNFGGSAGGSITGAAGASGGGSSSFFQLGGQYQSSLFADGGIMTKWGKAKLKQYANGGIAR